MQIEIGKRYKNKTWRFLYPCLRGHGDVFVRKLNPLYKLAVGINDNILMNTKYSKERNIFILVDTLYQPKCVEDFMNWVIYEDFYKHHYYIDSYDTILMPPRKLMIVLSVPEMFNNAYDKFLDSDYTGMYNSEEIKVLFNSIERKVEYEILTLDPVLHDDFINDVNTEFATSITSFDSAVKQYELPLKPKEEIFNYQSDNYYFIKELDKV